MSEPARVVPARRRGLADEVADRVRDAIFGGAYPPGAQLREVELAAALGVSRGPVREALLKLEREGLVRSEWHRGAHVTTLSDVDVAELDSLRSALEQLAVRLVVASASDADLAAIDEVVERMERARDEHEMVRCDIDFHDAVYAASGHRRLNEAWQAIRSQVHLFLLARIGVNSEGYLANIPAEHRRLASALRARDGEKALDLFAAHRGQALDVLTGK
ncbi:GntR family transcriptional regulator [Amycolatopsis regifaucium]|uniref:GntR family transcriptional regulator n=1 Tax=Amycolatopsis regifaucium TaxID=546365 RepID=A0A154MP70_9PSEU|nr:GntR family transcriptional regulator [Amycolatopsis regifaucium]KZB86102.1 GntR family transcriptional regulator [Amycolatopsis regifaucium]OKA04995.1 GntR family transcriptional regulator [Amycolatopsis regifaucium]SFH77947.1 DNA-binding transcriptional regulator, GntR family [Amycolatopsis regifaucium]